MRKTGLVVAIASGFVSGVAFIIACGNGMMSPPDANADCTTCEPPIGTRIYKVTSADTLARSIPTAGGLRADASCNAGDQLLGGGCWILKDGSVNNDDVGNGTGPLLGAGPMPAGADADFAARTYSCLYLAPTGGDTFKVHATAYCFTPAM